MGSPVLNTKNESQRKQLGAMLRHILGAVILALSISSVESWLSSPSLYGRVPNAAAAAARSYKGRPISISLTSRPLRVSVTCALLRRPDVVHVLESACDARHATNR
jgi:hypothetical protein